MKWTRDQKTEDWFDANEVPWKWVQGILFSAINRKRSWKNQSRITGLEGQGQLITGLLDKYTEDMKEDGASFPGGVLYLDGKTYLTADGNHRYEAFDKAGWATNGATIDAYVLQTDDEVLVDFVTRCLNTLNGLPPTLNERVEQAITMLDTHPKLSQKVVARKFGVSESAISRARRARKVMEVATKNGIRTDRVPSTVLSEIAVLNGDESVVVEAIQVATSTGATVDEVKDMVREAKRCKSESTRLESIRRSAKRLERGKPAPIEKRNPLRSQFRRAFTSLSEMVAKHPTAGHLGFSSKTEVEELRRDWHKLRAMMDKAIG